MLDRSPFRLIRNLNRSRQIITVLIRYGFGDVIRRLPLGRYLHRGRRLFFWNRNQSQEPLTRGIRIRLALENLGATFIKFGQVLSTRPDLVPDDVISELAQLQENVPPFPFEHAERRLRDEFGEQFDTLIRDIDVEPIAAGSLAQVHRAVLTDDRVIAIKVRRPGVVRIVERDLSLMAEIATLIEKYIPEAAPFDPVGLVQHFSKTIRRELNFYREGRTIEEFGELFRSDATLYVPEVFWPFCSECVVSMEFIAGLKVSDGGQLRAQGVDPVDVAANGARIFMKQAFELGLFHGDPHPGNIRVMPDGSLCLLDFGMVGILDDERREQLVDLLLAISRQDVTAAVQIVLAIGKHPDSCEEHLLRADLREFMNSYYGVSLERLRVGQMLVDFMKILSEHQIRCPANLMLLIRSIISLEGVGRRLDKDFNFAQHLSPFVERIVRERFSAKNLVRRAISETRTLARVAHEIPVHLTRTLERASKNELTFRMEHIGAEELKSEIDRVSNRIVIAVVLSSLILASALIIQTGTQNLWFSVPVFLFSSLLGIWLIYAVFRSGRL